MKKLVVQLAEPISSALQKSVSGLNWEVRLTSKWLLLLSRARLTQIGKKISQFLGNSYFYAEPQIFSLRSISAPTDSSNNPMKLELHQGADSHNFPTHLAGANGRPDELAYRDEFPSSLSYSANLSAVDADALLNTQLTVLGFPSLVNYQKYLKAVSYTHLTLPTNREV